MAMLASVAASMTQPTTPAAIGAGGTGPGWRPALEWARAHIEGGEYRAAEAAAREAIAQAERDHDAEPVVVADALDLLVDALYNSGLATAPETRAAAERSLAIRERALGCDEPEVATSLSTLAHLATAAGELAAARSLHERALSIRERVFGPDDPEVAASLHSLGRVLWSTGDAKGARALLERSLGIHERATGARAADLAEGLNDLGLLLNASGDASSARQLLARSIDVTESAFGPEAPRVATALANAASADFAAGDLEAARRRLERALEIDERHYGSDHLEVAGDLNNLATVLKEMGRKAAARPLYERVIRIDESHLGPDDPRLATHVNNLGTLHFETGDLRAARPQFERALAIREKALGPRHPLTATTVSNLGLLLKEVGDLEEARRHLERALDMIEAATPRRYADVATALNNLANLLQDAGNHAAARSLYERALATWEKALGPDHAHVAAALGNLATLLHVTGDDAGAQAHARRALEIAERALGSDHPRVATYVANLARLLATTDPSGAHSLHERALAIREKALGSNHGDVASSLSSLARLAAAGGDVVGAMRLAIRAEDIGRAQLRMTSHALSEREALAYAQARPTGLGTILSVAAARPDEPAVVRSAWDATLRSRGLVLDEIASRRGAASSGGDGNDPRMALAAARERLADLWVRGPRAGELERWRSSVDAARIEKEKAERAVAAISTEFASQQERLGAGLDDVLAALPADTALVAFVRHARKGVGTAAARASETIVPAYLAFVASAGTHDVVAVPLDDAASLEALVERWRNAVAAVGGDAALGRSTGEALRQRAWDPVAASIGSARRVHVVPDGALHFVNFAALPAPRGGWLVEGGPVIHHLSAERDLVGSSPGRQPSRGLLAMGGPAFDDTAPFAALAGTGKPLLVAQVVGLARGVLSRCSAFEALAWRSLPGAEREVAEVAREWTRHRHDEPTLKLAGADATEAPLKALAPGTRVLHLATHAFFTGAACEGAQPRRGASLQHPDASDGPKSSTTESPLLQSGLAFAGANHRSAAGPEEQDGVLTAEEVASLDLAGVEWAVLSACGTGLGDVRAGEGVLGLERAFRVAGARTVIMSLWSVDDEATRRWMRELYRARLERKLDTAECVREASLAVLRDRRAKGLDDSPFWWGAFVASGDWR